MYTFLLRLNDFFISRIQAVHEDPERRIETPTAGHRREVCGLKHLTLTKIKGQDKGRLNPY
jgi:hypothetical protein